MNIPEINITKDFFNIKYDEAEILIKKGLDIKFLIDSEFGFLSRDFKQILENIQITSKKKYYAIEN